MVTIGWYVHHQGSGHGARFCSIANALLEREPTVDIMGFGSVKPGGWEGPWTTLPRDDVPFPRGADESAGGALHWAPLLHEGMRQRSAAVVDWISRADCRIFVSDVSVEMLLLARLCSVPTVTFAMRGRRDDRAHILGYDISRAILAPWPGETQEHTPRGQARKIIPVGAFSRFDGFIDHDSRGGEGSPPSVLLVLGRGGHSIRIDELVDAASATPDWHWRVLGLDNDGKVENPSNITFLGQIRDIWSSLKAASVVAGPCGTNIVGEVAAARKPFIALPQSRPFDEQMAEARVLERYDLAEVAWTWPTPGRWQDLLISAATRDGNRWGWYNDGRGISRICDTIMETLG